MWNGYQSSQPFVAPLRPSVIIAGPPESEIISSMAMSEFLRLTTGAPADIHRIASLIVSARVHAERHTHRSLVKKPYVMSLSRFPNVCFDKTDKINLWYPPLTGDVSITYIDEDGASQDLVSGQDFQVDYAGEPGRVAPIAQTCWPATKWGVLNAVRIFYTAGYEAKSTERPSFDVVAHTVTEPEIDAVDVPEDSQVSTWTVDRTIPNDLVNAIMELAAHWYQNRVPVVTIAGAGGSHVVLPWHVEKILDDWTFDTMTPTISPEY